MKTAASKWPIVPPDSRLLALEELTEKWGADFRQQPTQMDHQTGFAGGAGLREEPPKE